jgi:DNA repair exonuclease SbcCD nuclease subunit
LAKENVDLVVHAGDFCGGRTGYKSVATTSSLLREVFPNTPIVAVLGNHDIWMKPTRKFKGEGWYPIDYGAPSLFSYTKCLRKIEEAFLIQKIHFLDKDGVFRDSRFPGVALVGHSGWYKHKPNSNDWCHLPVGLEGDTHSHLLKKAETEVFKNLDQLTPEDTKRVFVSHHPVIEPRDWGWDSKLGELLITDYSIKTFLNGHLHERHEGPLKWEAGSDYNNPRYVVLEV